MKTHVEQLVVQTMHNLADSIKTAEVGVEVAQVRIEDFRDECDIVFIEFCNIMNQKLGPDLSIFWRSGHGIKKDYASVGLNISAFRT